MNGKHFQELAVTDVEARDAAGRIEGRAIDEQTDAKPHPLFLPAKPGYSIAPLALSRLQCHPITVSGGLADYNRKGRW